MAPSSGMAMWPWRSLILFIFYIEAVSAAQARALLGASANPIRRTVKMLQAMQQKVEEEGKKEEELFEKFACFCRTGEEGLKASIAEANAVIPQLKSKLQQATAEQAQLKVDIAKAKSDRTGASEAYSQGEAIRKKGKAAFVKAKTDLLAYMAALNKAVKALKAGAAGAFLQSENAAMLRQLALTAQLSDTARELLTAFLGEGSSEGDGLDDSLDYKPQSPEIQGMLVQMLDDMAAGLQELEETEAQAVEDFEGMALAKEKEIAALTSAIEDKTERVGAAGVAIVNLKQDLGDREASLAEAQEFLKTLATSCSSKKKEWELRQLTRSDELLAISETIKLLNDDDALELFKKTLPSPSLLQIDVDSTEVKQRALDSIRNQTSLRKGKDADYRLNLIAMALAGKKVSLDKAVEAIDKLLAVLDSDQKADGQKQEVCRKGIAETDAQLKALQTTASDLSKRKEALAQAVEATTEEMAALTKGIQDLDKEVAEATQQRKEENKEFQQDISTHSAAIDLLEKAKKRLATFYNPTLRTAEEQGPELAEMQVASALASDQEAETGIPSFVQTSSTARLGGKSMPETWGQYDKKNKAKNQVVEMIDFLKADLRKDVATMQAAEKSAQAEYEELVKAAADRRQSITKALANKSAAKAAAEQHLLHTKRNLKATTAEAAATDQSLQELHADCDWLLKNFEAREQGRAGEVESLQSAKAILSGADLSFLQMSSKTTRRV